MASLGDSNQQTILFKYRKTMSKDEDSNVRGGAAHALGPAFQYMNDKEQASKDLLALTQDKDSSVRGGAAD